MKYSTIDSCSHALNGLLQRKMQIDEELKTLRELEKKYEDNVLPHLKRVSEIMENNEMTQVENASTILSENYQSSSPDSKVIKLEDDMGEVESSIKEEISKINDFKEMVETNMSNIRDLIEQYGKEMATVLTQIDIAESEYNYFLNEQIN